MLLHLVIGYCIAVLFPVPYLNGFIIRAWKALASHVEGWIKGSALPTPAYPTITPTPPPGAQKPLDK
jgi:hypothetical protein